MSLPNHRAGSFRCVRRFLVLGRRSMSPPCHSHGAFLGSMMSFPCESRSPGYQLPNFYQSFAIDVSLTNCQ
jgi:hypothetical protein